MSEHRTSRLVWWFWVPVLSALFIYSDIRKSSEPKVDPEPPSQPLPPVVWILIGAFAGIAIPIIGLWGTVEWSRWRSGRPQKFLSQAFAHTLAGRLEEAERCFYQSVAVQELAGKPAGVGFAMSLDALGRFLTRIGKYRDAEPHLARAVALLEPELAASKDNFTLRWNTADVVDHYADVMRRTFKNVEAVQLEAWALALRTGQDFAKPAFRSEPATPTGM